MPIISLLTDFGHESFFPAAMKARILGICPDATMVDITHDVPEHDIVAGGYALYATYCHFPKGTIHCCVVDPGVGGDRIVVAVELQGYVFLAPDNGLLSFLLKSNTPERIFAVENKALMAPTVSPTFHGRDIFAPVCAHLAAGTPIEEVGPQRNSLVRLDISSAEVTDGGIRAEVVSVDRFGNLVTNVRADILPESPRERRELLIRISGHKIQGVRSTYADVGLGELVAYIGSSGLMEIGRNRGSARDVLGAGVGHPVLITRGKPE